MGRLGKTSLRKRLYIAVLGMSRSRSRKEYSRQKRNYWVYRSSGWEELLSTWMKAAVRWMRGTLGERVKFQRQARARLCRPLEIISTLRLFLRVNDHVISCDLQITSNTCLCGLYHSPPATLCKTPMAWCSCNWSLQRRGAQKNICRYTSNGQKLLVVVATVNP